MNRRGFVWRGWRAGQQNKSHLFQNVSALREDADRVERWRQRSHASNRYKVMRWSEAPDCAIACGNAGRSGRIRSQRKLHQIARNRGSRSARRPTRHTIRRVCVKRRAVKVILTQQAESQLVANGFANAAGTGEQNLLHTDRVDYCGGMGIAPCRITTTGFKTGHIDRVFNSKAQSIQWTASGGRQIESRYESIALSNGDRGSSSFADFDAT